jgi:hypothetical protein
MTDHTHQAAPTQFVDGAGIRFAYRRFGKNEGVPLIFFQHFTGTMDNWDSAVTNGLARDREVILFNNAGISSSGGETPNTIAEMARHAAAFIDALGLEQVDLFGFSLGGFVAQQLTLDRPKHVRRIPRRNRTAQRRGNGACQSVLGGTVDWEVTRDIESSRSAGPPLGGICRSGLKCLVIWRPPVPGLPCKYFSIAYASGCQSQRRTFPQPGAWLLLLLVMFRHGLRVSEACKLKVTDINLKEKIIYIHRLKNGNATTQPMYNGEVGAVNAWHKARNQMHPHSNFLFLSERRKPLSRFTVCVLIKKYATAAGLGDLEIHPHMLRHACRYSLANRGADTRLI